MIKNKLKINDSKAEFIIFRSLLLKTDLSGVSISVGDSQISSSPKVRDLGVIFDNCLSFDAHISNICRSTHFHLRNIGRIRTLLTFHATAQLIHALITTRLDFVTVSFIISRTTKLRDYKGYKTKQHVC